MKKDSLKISRVSIYRLIVYCKAYFVSQSKEVSTSCPRGLMLFGFHRKSKTSYQSIQSQKGRLEKSVGYS